jgi:hypothetical protein
MTEEPLPDAVVTCNHAALLLALHAQLEAFAVSGKLPGPPSDPTGASMLESEYVQVGASAIKFAVR